MQTVNTHDTSVDADFLKQLRDEKLHAQEARVW
jgi:hypothetical protein